MSKKSDVEADSEITARWAASQIFPLWENRSAHRRPGAADPPYLWPWAKVSACIHQAIAVRDLSAVERRVLMLVGPQAASVGGASGTLTNINANVQILLPGEAARSHRHSMNALRFVLEGEGATTIVDGKECRMAKGDLITTPGWRWHEHRHDGDAPIVWLDILDASLHRYLGTATFEPGPPPNDLPATMSDEAFSKAGFLPERLPKTSASPMFRYPWASARAAVAEAPIGRDGARRIRYANPVDGGPCTAFLDCTLSELTPGAPTHAFRTSANQVCAVVEGEGASHIGETVVTWKEKDIFSMPQNNWISHEAKGGAARLFVVSDREIYKRLDLLTEDWTPSS